MLRRVKEVSELAGVSVRALHYYDEIRLLSPTEISEKGYRLYDERALERLHQIRVFRELEFSLSDIKRILDNPSLDRNRILAKQREMLCLKRERLGQIIASIDRMMEGEEKMDFVVFDKTELCAMFDDTVRNMNKTRMDIFTGYYGSLEAWKLRMLRGADDKKVQERYAKLVEWYGSKEAVMEAAKNPPDSEETVLCQKRIGEIQKELSRFVGTSADSKEVRQLIEEYDRVAKRLYQMDNVKRVLLAIAAGYRRRKDVQEAVDSVYGAGTAVYMGEAIAAYYNKVNDA